MKKLLFISMLLLSGVSISQFSTTYNASSLGTNTHLIHNSIAKSTHVSNFYVVASTVESSTGFDIQLTKIDSNGNVVWGKTIDLGQDDRALDVLVNKSHDILIVGYTSNGSQKELYVAKFDLNGGFKGDFKLVSDLNTVGTRIIESSFSGSYYIGGYEFDRELPFDIAGNGILIEMDSKLQQLKWKTEYKQTDVNNTVTDIVELPNGNLFLTGSLGGLNYGQVVLACIVDPKNSGALIPGGDFSFNNGDEFGLGASAVYDSKKDEVWLLFNSGTKSTPWYIAINNATSATPFINQKAYKVPRPGGAADRMAGYKITISPRFANSVTIFGYKDQTSFPAAATGFGFWTIDMKKYSMFPVLPPSANTNVKFWNPSGTSTSGIEYMGGDVLSLMSSSNGNGAPYFHTPQMMVESNLSNKFVVVSYDDQSPLNVETSVVAFNNFIPFAISTCFEQRDIQPFQQVINREEFVKENINAINYVVDIGTIKKQTLASSPYCTILSFNINNSRSAGNEVSVNDKKEEIENVNFKLFPNPTADVINIVADENILLKKIEVLNSVGQIVHSKNIESTFANTKIDVNQFVKGIYLVRIVSLNGTVVVKQFVKS